MITLTFVKLDCSWYIYCINMGFFKNLIKVLTLYGHDRFYLIKLSTVFDNRNGYGPVISSLPAQLSRFSFNLVQPNVWPLLISRRPKLNFLKFLDRKWWPSLFLRLFRTTPPDGVLVRSLKNLRTCLTNLFPSLTDSEKCQTGPAQRIPIESHDAQYQ